ncbi:hypothetical protein JW826_03525 [Candidatus Woesearchaeota archaeon]|nr:hypothetical protein [Candidatus Woesearchaeota archaeon]
MKEVLTRDGSKTFYSEEHDETYHSVSGAVEEAFLKYAGASDIGNIAGKGLVRILDVCFGLGYNTAAALDLIWAANPECKVEIVGLENDPEILARTAEVEPAIKSYGLIREAAKDDHAYHDARLAIKIIIGDAHEEIKKLTGKFDLVFHDPFSPKKAPSLWTEEFFREERRLMSSKGVLSTYSCARIVRENLKKAGFSIRDGPRVGRRAPSTIAVPD